MTIKCTDDKTYPKMPMLDHCWCCSLQVAASVIAVYTSVAYIIAFLIEMWWIWEIRGQVPYLAYILSTGYLVTFVMSSILVKGISQRRMSYLLLWLCGILAMILPEAGLAIFMGVQFWKVHTLHGLTEVTCWACRLTVNIAGIICVQSLYSLWREEKQVLTSLRDLNMVTAIGRRGSVHSERIRVHNSYTNAGYRDHLEASPSPMPHLQRSGSSLSLNSHQSLPVQQHQASYNSEFNASLFDTTLRTSMRVTKSRSMHDISPNGILNLVPGKQPIKMEHSQTLERKEPPQRLYRSHSVSYFPTGEGRLRNGYFAPHYPSSGFILDPLGRVAYIQDPQLLMMTQNPYFHHLKQNSKISLAESDDTQKYRDVAL